MIRYAYMTSRLVRKMSSRCSQKFCSSACFSRRRRAASATIPTPSLSSTRRISLCRPITSTSRSEEHTSELQSLMRISYAVFCLKKKKKKTKTSKNRDIQKYEDINREIEHRKTNRTQKIQR